MTREMQIGKHGEMIARELLTREGYNIIDSNYHCPYGEIDIIAMHEEVLTFVEVKTRSHQSPVPLLEAVSKNKINKILKSAEKYIDDNEISFLEMRVDVVLINYQDDEYETTLLKNYC